ncbi:hypothetical protein C8R44DRAFT_739373 [Mycena epipterygia]|nr:hypothetical protein C8R44DRAFT_739373 [Mycena epipterygia]
MLQDDWRLQHVLDATEVIYTARDRTIHTLERDSARLRSELAQYDAETESFERQTTAYEKELGALQRSSAVSDPANLVSMPSNLKRKATPPEGSARTAPPEKKARTDVIPAPISPRRDWWSLTRIPWIREDGVCIAALARAFLRRITAFGSSNNIRTRSMWEFQNLTINLLECFRDPPGLDPPMEFLAACGGFVSPFAGLLRDGKIGCLLRKCELMKLAEDLAQFLICGAESKGSAASSFQAIHDEGSELVKEKFSEFEGMLSHNCTALITSACSVDNQDQHHSDRLRGPGPAPSALHVWSPSLRTWESPGRLNAHRMQSMVTAPRCWVTWLRDGAATLLRPDPRQRPKGDIRGWFESPTSELRGSATAEMPDTNDPSREMNCGGIGYFHRTGISLRVADIISTTNSIPAGGIASQGRIRNPRAPLTMGPGLKVKRLGVNRPMHVQNARLVVVACSGMGQMYLWANPQGSLSTASTVSSAPGIGFFLSLRRTIVKKTRHANLRNAHEQGLQETQDRCLIGDKL